MKFTVKAFGAVCLLACVGMTASAGVFEAQAAGQLKTFDSLSTANIAKDIAVPVPARPYALTRDVFREVDACSILNAQFIMQPFMKDALSMLKPCLAGVSKLTGNAPISAAAVNNGKAIEIVVLGGANQAVMELVRGSLAKRNNQIFGYPSSVVLHAAEPHAAGQKSILPRDIFSEVSACSVVDAQFFMQPFMKDALNMLKPCLAGISGISAYAPISAEAVNNGKGIQIVVLGSKNDMVMNLIQSSIVKRNGQLFGYPAGAVLHAAAPLK